MNVKKLVFLNPCEIIPPEKSNSDDDCYRLLLLSESIRENGLLIPVTVISTQYGYRVVNGERRIKACILAGVKRIPCVVTDFKDEELLRAAESFCAKQYSRENLSVLTNRYSREKVALSLSLTTGELDRILNPEQKAKAKDNNKKEAKEEKKLPPIKDTRFLVNSIKQMIESVSNAGIPVKYKEKENDECLEIKIRVTKNQISPQLTLF